MRKKDKFGQIWPNSYGIRTNFPKCSVFTHLPCTFVRTKFVRISYEFRVNLSKFSHLVHCDHRVLPTILPISTVFPPHTMGRGDGSRPQEPLHLVADRTQRWRLQDL